MKTSYPLIILLALLLTACSTTLSGESTSEITVSGSSVIPEVSTPFPPDYTPPPFPTPASPTPLPTLKEGLPPTELKYHILDEFPDHFYCDPDYYPIAREDEADLARQRFPELQANAEEFQAILEHNDLIGVSTFTAEQKLLIYREHKRLAALQFELVEGKYHFQLQEAKTEGTQGTFITGTIDGQGHITIEDRTPSFATCPICLGAHTLIDTPRGQVAVEDLHQGDEIWTLDASGERSRAIVLKVARILVPANHKMVYLVLDDGRQLQASPGHPTANGRSLGDLQIGDFLDGGRVIAIWRILYGQPATYDVLPAGETGVYWANDILLGSTLK